MILISKIKIKDIHFAYDRIEDKDIIEPKFLHFRKNTKLDSRHLRVYVLTGDRERRVLESDLHRIYWLRDNGFYPYVMVYDKDALPQKHELRRLQDWVNNPLLFWTIADFTDYKGRRKKSDKEKENGV